MEEIQKLLPLLSFLGTICTAVTVAILLRASVERIVTDLNELKKTYQELRERVLVQETTCNLLHKPPEQSSGEHQR